MRILMIAVALALALALYLFAKRAIRHRAEVGAAPQRLLDPAARA
jgi:uncharacterized membrane protein YqhA